MPQDDVVIKSFGALEVKDAEQGEVTAIVATLNVMDKDGDVILSGALPAGGAKVKMSGYGHDLALVRGTAPAGKGVITEEGQHLVLRGKFFLSTERGREAFNTVKELGPDSEWSFGFHPAVKTGLLTPALKSHGARRAIAAFRPMEASPVFIGAGVGTGTVAVKAAESATEPPAAEPIQAKPADEDIRQFQRNQDACLKF